MHAITVIAHVVEVGVDQLVASRFATTDRVVARIMGTVVWALIQSPATVTQIGRTKNARQQYST